MRLINEIEKMLHQENRDKKRTARGVHAMRGKRGYVGVMRTPVDFMSTKEKKQYTKGSEIKVSNFYKDVKNIPSLEEIQNKWKVDPKGVTAMMNVIKGLHTNKTLQTHWKVGSCGTLYKVYNMYGVNYEKGKRGGSTATNTKKNVIKDRDIKISVVNPIHEPKQIAEQLTIQPIQPLVETDNEGFEIKYINKEVDGESVMDKITNYISILSKDAKYSVKLIIREVD